MLQVEDVHTYRGQNYVLQGVTLSIPDASCVTLLGRNGMGKTTLIRSLMGLTPPRSGTSLTLQELAASCGLETSDLKDLERFGLIASRTVGGTAYYDDDSLAAAHVAAGFMKFGVEARHLRMYKTAAEREAGFFEQVVMPMLKQRNPEARRQASETLSELARLGQQLRSAMLRNALRDYLEE